MTLKRIILNRNCVARARAQERITADKFIELPLDSQRKTESTKSLIARILPRINKVNT